MTFTKSKYLMVSCVACVAIAVCASTFAAGLGQHPSKDTPGGPGTSKEVNDNRREPKAPPEPRRRSSADDPKPERPAVKPPVVAPVVLAPTMDKQEMVDALSVAFDNLNKSEFVRKLAPDPKLGIYVGGIGAALDAAKWAKDMNTLVAAQVAISKFEMSMKPGEISHIQVSATPEGKVNVIKLTSPNAPVISDGKSNSFNTTISAPNFNRPQDASKTETQKQLELRDWYKTLDKKQKDIIDIERRKRNLPPVNWPA